MSQINWKQIGLQHNPFNIVPDRYSNDLIWAGFPSIKAKLDSAISEGLSQEGSKLTLIISRYGGGKTHSSFYFSNSKNLPLIIEPTPISIVVQTPKDGSYAADEFFMQILERITIAKISNSTNALRQHEDGDTSLEILQHIARSEDLGRIAWLLGDEDPDIRFMAEQTLMGNNPNASTKNKLRIRRGIQSHSDKSQILSALFWLLSHYNNGSLLDKPRKIMLWIDELESLIYYTSKQYRPFTQAIRELIDFTPKDLCIFMNFSFSDPSDVSNVEIVIGEALIDRINTQIVFEEASIDDSMLYVRDLMHHLHINQDSHEYYPLNKEIVTSILTRAPIETGKPLMPRSINKWLQLAFNELSKMGFLTNDPNIVLSNIDEINFEPISL